MNNQKPGTASQPRQAKSLGRFNIPAPSTRVAAYLLCLGVLIPSLGFAAYLISRAHSRELSIFQEEAQTRAALAATFFDDQIAALVQTLKTLPPVPAAATGNTPENIGDRIPSELGQKGIQLFTRGQNLNLLSPVGGLDASLTGLDGTARSAAEAALTTMAPQITAYNDAPDKGINLWVAAQSSDLRPVLLQARIPSTYIASALKNFAAGGPWSISLVGPRGNTIAKARAKPAFATNSIELNRTPLIEVVADTTQFGWKVAAQIPEKAAERHTGRNWITFVTLSSLLVVASFASATWLTRNISQERNAGTPAPPSWDPTEQAANRTAGMTLPFNNEGAEPRSRELAGTREQRLRQALRAGNVGVWEWNLETGNIHWDSEISEIFSDLHRAHDYPARELLRRVERLDRRRLLKAVRAAVTGQKPLAVEVPISARNGEIRWIAIRGAPAETAGRKVTTLTGVSYDVTDQKLSLTRTDALLREVSHRSKNLLALILAMARLTARDAVNVKSHLKDFTLRVAGLSASQDLIVASDWQSVDLATLAAAEIGAVARTDADRVAIMGPPVMLTPEAAQTLGMVLTELALNAVEHGALSAATGEVKLKWTLPDASTILISWRETGGPPFLSDGPKGYGMSVVERFSTQGLKLSARADGNADEFTWTLTGPLANVGHAQKAAVKA